ncbi:hypothetical protein [Carboxylicivirga caseinilyticus]|uniref:hypothetical protein n=1 Tax=Carboxylicivirga caseinilyticus TaxID=3417572 RepID=UPI003D32F576|nr:hypothetical protein [Marinilabiliaceae bacterium A049]
MNKFILLTILTAFSTLLNAQWNCRSRLGAFLKPVGQSNLMWAAEVETSQGYLTNSHIANGMTFLGLDYSTNHSTFYFEGGVKYWRQKDLETDYLFSNHRFGLREAFYKYQNDQSNLMIGLHSATLNDHYLLNERMLGVSYKYSGNQWKINFSLGSVSNDFARNGTFCSTCYLYDIIPDRTVNSIGSDLWKTNLAAFTLSFLPGKSSDSDEFSSEGLGDEFSSMNEFETNSSFKVSELGWAVYTEFGSQVETSFLSTGLFADVSWGENLSFKPEILYQSGQNNQGIIYDMKLQKDFIWGNMQKSSLLFNYYDFTDISADANVLNRFSNILAGEVLRLDATDMPIFLTSVKHTFPKVKTHFKLQYACSNQISSMQEVDLQCGKIFFKHLQASAIMGYIKSDLIENDDHAVLGRLELRFNF